MTRKPPPPGSHPLPPSRSFWRSSSSAPRARYGDARAQHAVPPAHRNSDHPPDTTLRVWRGCVRAAGEAQAGRADAAAHGVPRGAGGEHTAVSAAERRPRHVRQGVRAEGGG
eukprot:1189088-Prorocentrum_minimum.AAC.3